MLTFSEDVVYMVRLLTYVPGDRVETVPYTSQLLYQLGQTIASFNNALQVTSTSHIKVAGHRKSAA